MIPRVKAEGRLFRNPLHTFGDMLLLQRIFVVGAIQAKLRATA
jgi:hypothetical protein